MANIFLTRKCNLKCPYCFAEEFVNKENEEVTIENCKKIIDFIKKNGNKKFGLIGGEPTLHPNFREILKIIIEDEGIKEITIFTNGLLLDKYKDIIFNEKFVFLINCNSPSDIGEKQYQKLRENIKLMKKNSKKFTLGINIYKQDMNFDFIFELLKIADMHTIRISTALPNDEKEQTNDILENFMEMKPALFKFFKECIKNDISPFNDCNSFPECLLTIEDKRILLQLNQIAKKYNVGNAINSCNCCAPVIDILPDLQAVRCFGLSKYIKASINDFKSLDTLNSYFFNKIDLYSRLSFVKKECENCRFRLLDKCGICYTYKIKSMEKIKNFAVNNC